MDFLKDRRVLLALGGAGAALAGGIAIALAVSAGRKDAGPSEPPPASRGGLVVEAGPVDETRMDPARPLRCFVAGRFVGDMTLVACARLNGVATGALDVGLDETGALAAAGAADTTLKPLPQAPVQPPSEPEQAALPDAQAPSGACWRYAGEWKKLPSDMTLNACVQALFAGRCEHSGGATYGRWMQQTLRLVPGRVEVSGDNRGFRPLVEQGPGCAIPPVG